MRAGAIWLFSLFPYAVIIEEPAVCVDSFWSAAIDPYHGTFTTLFVGAVLLGPAGRIPYRLPVPERDMARQLSNLPLGGLKQAVAAARHALRFVDRIRSEHNTGPSPCLLLLWSGPRRSPRVTR